MSLRCDFHFGCCKEVQYLATFLLFGVFSPAFRLKGLCSTLVLLKLACSYCTRLCRNDYVWLPQEEGTLEGCLEFMEKVVQELETGIRHADMHISEATWGHRKCPYDLNLTQCHIDN